MDKTDVWRKATSDVLRDEGGQGGLAPRTVRYQRGKGEEHRHEPILGSQQSFGHPEGVLGLGVVANPLGQRAPHGRGYSHDEGEAAQLPICWGSASRLGRHVLKGRLQRHLHNIR